MAGKTELNNKCNELRTQIDDYKGKISTINNALLATKSKKSQLIIARGDLQAARTWIQTSIENFRENYNGSETAENKLKKMKKLKNDMKLEFNSLDEVWIEKINTVIKELNDLKTKYQTQLENYKSQLAETELQLAKLNNS